MGDGGIDPRRRGRAVAGWTKRMRGVFLDTLAVSGSVRQAARAAGGAHAAAYAVRRRDAAFAEAWDGALRTAYARLEAELLARAIGDPLIAGEADAGFDAALALKVLARHETVAAPTKRRTSATRIAPIDAVERALARKLAAVAKHLPVAA